MKKVLKKLICVISTVLLVGCSFVMAVSADSILPYTTYTYTRSGDMVESPDVYTIENNIKPADKNGKVLNYPTDFSMDLKGNFLIADNGNNRVVCFDKDGNELWQLDSLSLNGETFPLNQPYCILQSESGNYYISDAGPANENGDPLGDGRIYKLDSNRNLIEVFKKPKISQLADDGISYNYKPLRFVVDSAERIYVIAESVNQGFIQLNKNGEFQGFIGAPDVTYDAWELILREFSTEEQKSRMESFVPTEYCGVDIDTDGFIYATTQTYEQSDINSVIVSQVGKGAKGNTTSSMEMIRKINASGTDILRRTGAFSPIGDVLIPNIGVNGAPKLTASITRDQLTVTGSSKFVDITTLHSGMYAAVDINRNRIFLYDYDGNLICVFGSRGTRFDSFSNPVAIEYFDGNLYVLNSKQGSVSVCKLTDYGTDLFNACTAQYEGDVEQTLALWNKVLVQNTNCELAYDAIGKAYLDFEEAETAMRYFKLSSNHDYYSQAYKIYRDDFVGQNFLWVICAIIAVFGLIAVFKRLMQKIGNHQSTMGRMISKSNYCFYTLVHPFDGFYCLKHEKRGSAVLGVIQILILGLTSVLKTNASGYCFNYNDIRYENILFTYLTVILPYFLFTIANWCLITLFDGKGTYKDIIVLTGCSTIPLSIANFIYFILSHICVVDEAALMSIFITIGTIWMVFLFFAATVSIHDYTAGKSIVSLLCTVLCIVIIIFLALFLYDVISQIIDFITMLYNDLSIR